MRAICHKSALMFAALFVSASPISVTSAYAASLTYAFEGTINNSFQFSAPIREWTFAQGQRFFGTFTYDLSAIQSSQDIVNNGSERVTRYTSPITSFEFSVVRPEGNYFVDYPTEGLNGRLTSSALVRSQPGFSAVQLSPQNYPLQFRGNPSEVPFPSTAFIGRYTPHALFFFLSSSNDIPALSNVDPNIDFVKFFNGLGQNGSTEFVVRFSDSFAWNVGVERVDATFDGRIERLVLVQSAIPEPKTWAMMLIGFGFVGSVLRKRTPHRKIARQC